MIQLSETKVWVQNWLFGWLLLAFYRFFPSKGTEPIEYNSNAASKEKDCPATTVKESLVQLDVVNNALSETTYAMTTRKLMDVVNALRRCGAEEQLDLPKIAVIGNQSVGKSSLIESISGIKVPRSQGTCTRCPMEVTLRSDKSVDKWTCQVSVYDEKAKKPVPFGKPTHDRDEVESILRRAQLATLNPRRELTSFVNLDDAECDKYEYILDNPLEPNEIESEKAKTKPLVSQHDRSLYSGEKFSERPIVVEINGDDVDLTFIDLPGLISNTKVRLR